VLVVQDMRLSIKHPVAVALAIGAAAVGLAACGGGESDDNASRGADGGSGIVSIQSVDGTDVLVDSAGRTLYTADVEQGGRILCTGPCTSFWDPIGASAQEVDSASTDLDLDLGLIKRPDGGEQLTFAGLPLYSFTEEGPGQLDGDGFVDDFQGTHFEWAAAATGPASGSSDSGASNNGSPY
jgi:predicted lipoprotein with Yx(FWY)xxD motif